MPPRGHHLPLQGKPGLASRAVDAILGLGLGGSIVSGLLDHMLQESSAPRGAAAGAHRRCPPRWAHTRLRGCQRDTPVPVG